MGWSKGIWIYGYYDNGIVIQIDSDEDSESYKNKSEILDTTSFNQNCEYEN